jgi:hypothetical protein
MLNLDDTISILLNYNIQRDLLNRIIGVIPVVIILVDLVRNQVSEIDLVQLAPGFYLLLLLISFLIILYFSDLINNSFLEGDYKKELGTKNLYKLKSFVIRKTRFNLFFLFLILILNTVLPISLDSFDSYDEKTLDNGWSFDEVVSLEIFLASVLVIISQLPVIAISNLTGEKESRLLPDIWKIVSFLIVLFAGILTPTIDGYTQVSFAGCTLLLYFYVVIVVQKKTNIRSSSISILGS